MSVEGIQSMSEAAPVASESLSQALDSQAVESSESAEQEAQSEVDAQPESAEEQKLSSKFATLSRKEKQIREREAQLDRKMQLLEEKLSKFESLSSPMQQPESVKAPEIPLEVRLKKNPLETLNELGYSFETLTNLALNGGKLTPDMQMELMKQELEEKYNNGYESLKKEMAERDSKRQEAEADMAVKNFKREIDSFVAKTESYELIQANDASELVFEVIENYYEQTGEVLDIKQAADHVEAQLEEEAEKLFKLNKLKSKFAPVQKAPEPKPELKKPVQTLSNAHSAGALSNRRPATREESLAEAARLIRWKE